MRFFIDQCVPESVAKVLESHNHEVVRLREKIAPESPDPLVAAVAETNLAILVTMDGDFRKIASRHSVGQRRFRNLSLIRFTHCIEAKAASRIEAAMSLIEHEWQLGAGLESRDRRMFVVIISRSIRTNR